MTPRACEATLRDLPACQRPREKLCASGPGALSEAELLAVLLGSGLPGEDALSLARRLAGLGLERLATASVADLCRQRGLGRARAALILAALELGRRACQPAGPPVSSPEEAYALLADMAELRKEHFQALYLDSRRRLMRREVISIGTLTSSLVHPREVFQPAVERSAAALVVGHNHPSGDPEPSPEDLALTRRLRQAGEILGIELLDHLVIGRGRYVSLKQRGVL